MRFNLKVFNRQSGCLDFRYLLGQSWAPTKRKKIDAKCARLPWPEKDKVAPDSGLLVMFSTVPLNFVQSVDRVDLDEDSAVVADQGISSFCSN